MIAQREFRREFGIHRNRAVPSAHAIKTLVRNFEATGSALQKKGGCVNKLWRNPSFSETVDINFDMYMSYRWLFHATA